MKQCFKCGNELPISCFYKHKQMADGHLNKCKSCTKKDVFEHRQKHLKRIQEYDRNRPNAYERAQIQSQKTKIRRKNDPDYARILNEANKKWASQNSLKRAANYIVSNAVRDGILVRKPCEICGEEKADAHHDDYYKPLSVRWLCRKHHAEHHKNQRNEFRKHPARNNR